MHPETTIDYAHLTSPSRATEKRGGVTLLSPCRGLECHAPFKRQNCGSTSIVSCAAVSVMGYIFALQTRPVTPSIRLFEKATPLLQSSGMVGDGLYCAFFRGWIVSANSDIIISHSLPCFYREFSYHVP